MIRWVAIAVICAAAGCAAVDENGPSPFDLPITDERPRVFIRAHGTAGYEGLTVGRLRERSHHPEYARRRYKMKRTPLGRALEWLIDGKRADLDASVAGLKKMGWTGGNVSDRGMSVVRLAALYDWVRTELDEPTRKEVASRIEAGADYCVRLIENGESPFYYSRMPGALAAVTVAGIALKGDSPRAEGYLKLARTWGPRELFKSFEWVDGAATGGRYTFYYTYVDVGHLLAAWWSATGRNPAPWLRRRQGDWPGKMVRFHLWYLRPGISWTDCNDQRMGNWNVKDQYAQALDLLTYVTGDGLGRELSIRWNQLCGVKLYHTAYIHNFIFWDPTVRPQPWTDLPRAEVFGRESCGYVFFRSTWPKPGEPDTATHVYFRAGDPMNVHGSVTAGQFQIFKHAPLAARSSLYTHPYDCEKDQYHRNAISTNVVLFTDPKVAGDRGDQRTRNGLKWNHGTWDAWLEIRREAGLDVARITDWRVGGREARCRVDLSKANPASKCRTWIRELVWLGYKHLVVLDVVEAARSDIRRTWQLHAEAPPAIGDRLVRVVNRPPDRKSIVADDYQEVRREGTLFCRTLLPRDYLLVVQRGAAAKAFRPNGSAAGAGTPNAYHQTHGKHVVQIDAGSGGTRTVFLHVLSAVDGSVTAAPKASCRVIAGGKIEVTVDGLTTELTVPAGFIADN